MSAQCQACTAPAELFLCRECTTELRANLTRLAEGPYIPAVNGRTRSGGAWRIERRSPGLIANLTDVTLRQTRIGGGGGHRKRGDEMAGLFEPDTENGRQTRQGSAAMLLDAVRNGLSSTVRDLCESRGVELPRCDSTAQIALWLATNVHVIACDEAAGQWHTEIDGYVRRIERVIDRPTRRTWLGDCPTWNDQARRICGVSLWAPEDAIEVHCQRCRNTHNCKRLQLLTQNDLEREKVPWERILRANKSQPLDRQIPERTLQSWRRPGRNGESPKLKARGYRRPDGREAPTRHSDDDEPLFLWPDVRKLREAKPQKARTGAAAHRKKAG